MDFSREVSSGVTLCVSDDNKSVTICEKKKSVISGKEQTNVHCFKHKISK